MQAIRNAASHVPGSQSCWQRNWPRVFLLFSLASTVLCFVAVIFGLINIVLNPSVMLLSIYCLIFALLGFSAEMRQFSWCRRVVYLWMRYFYFLTYYKARAIFYIMFGCLLIGNGVLAILAAIVTVFLGVMMLLVSLIVDLPVFEDPRELQEKEEEYRNYYSGPNPTGGAGPAADPAAANAQNMSAAGYSANNNTNNDVHEDTPAQFNSGAQPTQSAKVPPSAMPAQANTNNNNSYQQQQQTYRDSSDDEPAQPQTTGGFNRPNFATANANPYETSNNNNNATYTSADKSGPGMFAPSTTSRTTTVAPPLQEAGVTRGGTESAIRRDFAAAVASNVKDDDLR